MTFWQRLKFAYGWNWLRQSSWDYYSRETAEAAKLLMVSIWGIVAMPIFIAVFLPYQLIVSPLWVAITNPEGLAFFTKRKDGDQ